MKRLAILIAVLVPVFCLALEEPPPEDPKPDSDVLFLEEIGSTSVTDAKSAVETAARNSRKELLVKINSPGGSVLDGLEVVRILMEARVEVVCQVEGMAASMAAAILESQACDRRYVRPWSILMFHEASLGAVQNWQENTGQSMADSLRAVNRAIAALIAPRVGLTVDQYLAKVTGGREWWVAGIDAVGQNLADAAPPPPADRAAEQVPY